MSSPRPRTSSSHPLRVDFVAPRYHDGRGRLGLTFAPGKHGPSVYGHIWQRDVDADLTRLRRHYRTDLLVSLIEDHEFALLGITELAERAAAHGIAVTRFPIVDVDVPAADAADAYAAMMDDLATALRADRTVVLHCRGGLGRSGLVAASVLTRFGVEPDAAIAAVRAARPGAIETPAQEDYVRSAAERGARRG